MRTEAGRITAPTVAPISKLRQQTSVDIAGHDYRRLAELHRPQDQNGLRLAARDLARQGLRERDIAAALGLSPSAVAALLKDRAIASGAQAAALHQTA